MDEELHSRYLAVAKARFSRAGLPATSAFESALPQFISIGVDRMQSDWNTPELRALAERNLVAFTDQAVDAARTKGWAELNPDVLEFVNVRCPWWPWCPGSRPGR